jgi:DNA mismatch repair protein MSH5
MHHSRKAFAAKLSATQLHHGTCTAAASSRSRAHARPGPFLSTSSTLTPSEALQHSDVTIVRDVDDDTLDEIVMAVDMTPRGAVGCCYYVARDEKLYFMEDVQLGDVNVVDGRK